MRFCAAIFAALYLLVSAPASAQTMPFSALAGCWRTSSGVTEQWIVDGAAMRGSRVTPQENGVQFLEWLALETNSSGRTTYTDSARWWSMNFVLSRRGAEEAVFDSLSSEPPLRVAYRLRDDTLIISWYETRHAGETPSSETYTRGCEDDPVS